ncbi:hypothetical protein LSTR_LSTR008762 [Laodelphax striatellus]|uniref:Uncharacterized protein n=1 Tax=Laodelphax striatellus TaxID=195883 RepID=A0A482XR82_LAOST|nr:hypothetical protein LSTR_LSTR008762 [Laodelphax striatellus]
MGHGKQGMVLCSVWIYGNRQYKKATHLGKIRRPGSHTIFEFTWIFIIKGYPWTSRTDADWCT